MTYIELKELNPNELMKLIERTAHQCKDMPLIPMCDHRSRELNAPTLCMIGDFEIRARFYTPEHPDTEVSCR